VIGPAIVAKTTTPEGHEIVLLAEPDVLAGRERMFRRGGPKRRMRVVIDTEQIITAFAQNNDPV
jgi:hypothetical protein